MHQAHAFRAFRQAAPFLLVFASSAPGLVSQTPRIALDAADNIVLIAQDGHRTTLAERGHCNETRGTPDDQLLACFVSRGTDDHGFRPQFEIEIYRSDGRKLVLAPGGAIRDWHFWNDYEQIAISYTSNTGHRNDALYDSDTGRLADRIDETDDPSHLPQWAKSRSQIDDESVTTDSASQEMRNKWIDKILRQILAIQPGMRRSDLDALFRQDGGINPIGRQYRYVLKECPSIKIDVQFKDYAGTDQSQQSPQGQDAEIESVSKPYLQWSIMD